ncbi:hypothetical protein BOTBODRAFT_70765 [Botryobasidium botryosum FD-172 SS1]|uniref:Uncharacterized protein n=1 Tax=Botryobasidium botryosum (strain FD-172 SS1) TaxID=930990 RepID=A0A067LU90_BOTB1|nr:hypothetical protein BOTBODRAFT_70765 [Botryobasidium botryosum FD-172 SS1]
MPTNGPGKPVIDPSEPAVDHADDSNQIHFYPLVHGFVPAVNAMGETEADLLAPPEPIVEVWGSIDNALDALACLAASSPGQRVAISVSFYESHGFTNIRVAQDGYNEVSPAMAEFVRTVWGILVDMSKESKEPGFRRVSAGLEGRLREVVYKHVAHRTLHRISKRWNAFQALEDKLPTHYKRYFDRASQGLANIRRELESATPNHANVFKSMELVHDLVARVDHFPSLRIFLKRDGTKKRATLSHYLQKCSLVFPCICALKASISDQRAKFTEAFEVERVPTLLPPSLSDEYPPNSAAWRAQFSDMLRRSRTLLRDPERGDKLVKMAEELATREGRTETVHCESTLLVYCDRYLEEEGAPYHYFGTSTLPCYMCKTFFRAYADVMPFRVAVRGPSTTRWKVPKSWIIVPFDDDGRYERVVSLLMERVVTRTAKELVRQNIGLEAFWYELEGYEN